MPESDRYYVQLTVGWKEKRGWTWSFEDGDEKVRGERHPTLRAAVAEAEGIATARGRSLGLSPAEVSDTAADDGGHEEGVTSPPPKFRGSEASGRWTLTRYAMYRALEGRFSELDAPDRSLLSVSRSDPLAQIMGLQIAAVIPAEYPDRDIASLGDIDSASVDFVVADQVLEHVERGPLAAFAECARVVKPGGYVVVTTCLMNEVHQAPMDFWRFTTFGLRALSESSGLDVVELDSWGNREASLLMHNGFRKTLVPEDERHPLYQVAMRNDHRHPISTWVVARRPPERSTPQ